MRKLIFFQFTFEVVLQHRNFQLVCSDTISFTFSTCFGATLGYHKKHYTGNEKDIKISIHECDSSLNCDRSLQQLLASMRIGLEVERIRLMNGLVTRSFVLSSSFATYLKQFNSHTNWFNTRNYKNFLAKEDLKWRQRILTTMRHITYQSVR